MALFTTTARTTVKGHMGRVLAWVLVVFGIWFIGQGLWIPVKASAAQLLLQHAWARTLKTQQPAKPWPWADTWPVGRLLVPQHGIDQIILADASGRSLAFGPGQLAGGLRPGEPGMLVVSGHRDTHFSFLRDVQKRGTLLLQTIQGNWIGYTVEDIAVLDSRTDKLFNHQFNNRLVLITCYPFDALVPGGPLRYVVMADQMTSEVMSALETGKAP